MLTLPVVCGVVAVLASLLPLFSADHPSDGPFLYTTKASTVKMPDKYHKAIEFVHSEASEICSPFVDRLIEVELKEGERIRKTGAKKTGSFRFVQFFKGASAQDKHLFYSSYLQTECLSVIRKRFTMSNAEMKQLLPHLPNILQKKPSTTLKSTALQCPYPINITCSPVEYYRTYNGRCNNLLRPLWGSSHQPLVRFLQPDYSDVIWQPRVARSGKELPNARLVTASVHQEMDVPDHLHTLMLMQMGQFVDHDMSKTAITKIAVNPERTELWNVECGDDGCQTDGPENRECYPIFIPRNDPVYGGHKRCMMFVRSLGVPNENCLPGPREHVNQLTSLLDASLIYGNTEKDALELRDLTPNRGRMKVTHHPAGSFKPILPQDLSGKDCLGGDKGSTFCFKAGDSRVSEWTGLTTQHTVWVRQHNRIEEKLHELNPHWDGERLYQETRRIVVALWQFAIYNEYLPVILGHDAMLDHDLQLVHSGYWNGYDESVNPTIANSFATAAFRFGHTQVQSIIHGRDAAYNVFKNITLSTQFFHPHVVYKEPHWGIDMMMLALVGDSAQTCDQFVSKQLTSRLFTKTPPHGLGEDLSSINIQRGRDHGIPGYNRFRQWCGMKKAATFEDLVELPAKVVYKFRHLYEHVDDIDLWPAIISERPYNGAVLGPTGICIIARQFHNLKFGDRFWFENNLQNPYPFTEAQLAEIRKFKYAKVMCENADYLPWIQPEVFFHPLSVVVSNIANHQPRDKRDAEDSRGFEHIYGRDANERVPCQEIPDIDLRPWKETRRHPYPTPASGRSTT